MAEVVLADWAGFKARVQDLRGRPDVLELKDWGHAVAVVQATLDVLFERVLGELQPEDVTQLPRRLAGMLHRHRSEAHPAEEAFEQIRTLMVQGERRPIDHGVALYLGREFVGWRSSTHWHLLTSSQAFQQRLGGPAVQLHGRRWVERGWVVPGPRQGSSTQAVYCAPKKGTVRVLVIPREVLEGTPDEV